MCYVAKLKISNVTEESPPPTCMAWEKIDNVIISIVIA